MRSVITRRDRVHPYPPKIQSRFSWKQSFRWKIFILYFRLIFSCRVTPFSLVPPVTEHPVYIRICIKILVPKIPFQEIKRFLCLTRHVVEFFLCFPEASRKPHIAISKTSGICQRNIVRGTFYVIYWYTMGIFWPDYYFDYYSFHKNEIPAQ